MMTSERPSEIAKPKLSHKHSVPSHDSSFWNLLTLDHYVLDKELDDAAVRAYERLHYGQHGRPRPQVDIEETNTKTTVEPRKAKSLDKEAPKSRNEEDKKIKLRSSGVVLCANIVGDFNAFTSLGEGETQRSHSKVWDLVAKIPAGSAQSDSDESSLTSASPKFVSNGSSSKELNIKHPSSLPPANTPSKKNKRHQRADVSGKKIIPLESGTKVSTTTITTVPAKATTATVKQNGILKKGTQLSLDKAVQSKPTDPAVTQLSPAAAKIMPDVKEIMDDVTKDNRKTDVAGVDNGANSASEEQTIKADVSAADNADSSDKSVITTSTLPTEAKLQFLWAKTFPTKTTSVQLKIDKIKEPITLHYVREKDIFLSGEVSIPCGNYQCFLLVASRKYKTEPIEVKHYTFEVDLYVEDDDDTVPTATAPAQPWQTVKVTADRSDVSSKHRSEGTAARNNETLSRRTEPLSRTGPVVLVSDNPGIRQAPVNMDDVMEGDEGEIRRSNRLEMLLRQQMLAKGATVGGGTSDAEGRREPYSDGFRPVVSTPGSHVGSKQSIASSEQELTKYLANGEARHSADYEARTSLAGCGPIARSRSVDTLNKDAENSSYGMTYRHPDGTPAPSGRSEYAYDLDLFETSAKGHAGVTTSTPSGDYKTPADFHLSRDSLDRHGDSYTSLPGIQHASADTRRETGYLEQSQRQHTPTIRTPLLTTRAIVTPRISRTVDRELSQDSPKMKELEETIISLQRALSERDRDLQIIKRERCHLAEEVQRLRQIYETPTEGRDQNEKRINQLIQEKENLMTEVWKLKRELEAIKDTISSKSEENGYHDGQLDSYNPNNPSALQRKIDKTGMSRQNGITDDLQSQVQDMSEAHESTLNKLTASESEITKLKEENRSLRLQIRNRGKDMEEENIRLRDQITRLQDDGGEYLRQELARVRDELMALRSKNHQLMQDNIKLTEHLRRVDPSISSAERTEIRNRIRSPTYDVRRSELLTDVSRSNYVTTKVTKLEEDEQFVRDRHRLTQEFRQIAAPQKWSDREYRCHDDEDLHRRSANHDLYSRAKSAPPIRRRDGYDDASVRLDPEGRHPDRYNDGVMDRHVDTRDRNVTRLPRPPREDTEIRARLSSQETRPHNNYHGSLSSGQHERHLSETSNATAELTRACPLGQGKNPGHNTATVDDYHHNQVTAANGVPRLAANIPDANHLTSDFDYQPRHKSYEAVDDVMDSLHKVPMSRCHLKVDLVDDVMNGINGTKTNPRTFKNVPADVHHGAGDQMSSAPGVHSHHNTSSGTQNSTVDDLLDASLDDPGFTRRKRQDSMDSCSTDAILRAADEEMNQINIDKNSVACDTRGGSLRSVSPRPVITQHNKGTLRGSVSSKPSSHCYATKRPFAPRSPADVNIGDIVKFCRHGGKISKGVVKYIGHLPGKNDTYLGLELEHEMAKHDGVYEGVRYFQSKPNRGVFVAFSKVVMAWGE